MFQKDGMVLELTPFLLVLTTCVLSRGVCGWASKVKSSLCTSIRPLPSSKLICFCLKRIAIPRDGNGDL